MSKSRTALKTVVASVAVFLLSTSALAATASTASAQPAPTPPSAVTSVHFSKHSTKGAYSVTPLDLPVGAKASAVVTGPHHYKKKITLSSTASTHVVRPGAYVIAAASVVVKATGSTVAGTYTPVVAKLKFTVKKRKTIAVHPDYADIVAPGVKVAAASAVSPVVAPADPADPYLVTIKGTYPTGGIIASGVSASAPDGLLVKVVEIGDTSSAGTQYTVENANLEDAVPRGSFSQLISNPATLNSTTPGSETARQGTSRKLTTDGAHPAAGGSNVVPYLHDVDCKAPSTTASLKASIEGKIDTKFSANWDLFNSDNDSVTMSSTTSLTGALSAEISGKTSCELDKTELLVDPIELGTIEFFIGPVPIVINNTLNFTIAGSAEVGAKLHEGVSSVLSMTTAATIDKNGLTPSSTGPTLTNTYDPPTLSASGSAEFYLGARLNMLLYGVAGPFVEAELGPKIDVDTTEKPWWALTLELKVGAGLRADLLGFKPIEDDHIFAHSFPILDSDSFGDATAPVGGPGQPADPGLPTAPPDPTPPTDPGDGGIPVQSSSLDDCINDALGKPLGSTLSPADMLGLTSLSCVQTSPGISDLSPLAYATNLQFLNLDEDNTPNTFSDLNALAGLKKLTTLQLNDNPQITDASALASLSSLTTLRLNDDSGIGDVSELLPHLRSLRELDLEDGTLEEQSALASLPKLTTLNLLGVDITSTGMTVISHKPLTSLSIGSERSSGTVADIQDIGSMDTLTSLDVEGLDSPDPTFLLGLPALTRLAFKDDGLTSVTAFARFTHLVQLDVSDNSVLDLTPLAPLTSLQFLIAQNQSVNSDNPLVRDQNYDYPTITGVDGHRPSGSGELFAIQNDTCEFEIVDGTNISLGECSGHIGWSIGGSFPSGLFEEFSGVILPKGSFV